MTFGIVFAMNSIACSVFAVIDDVELIGVRKVHPHDFVFIKSSLGLDGVVSIVTVCFF